MLLPRFCTNFSNNTVVSHAAVISCWRKVIQDTQGINVIKHLAGWCPLYRPYSVYISPGGLKGIKEFFVLQQQGDNLQISMD